MAKGPEYLGIWANITGIFPAPVLATILGTSLEAINAMAHNVKATDPGTAMILGHLCELHGAQPVLFQQWEKHQGVMIGSVAEGWMAWSLKNGWKHRTRWIGGPHLLIPAAPETILEARAAGWR